MLKSVIREYGISWIINRALYATKLKAMASLPFVEKIFEKKVDVKKTNIFSVDSKRLAEFLNKLSYEDKKNLINEADKAIVGKILGFSSIDLDYGNPINWHLNPLTGYVMDNKIKWFKISDFDRDRGDIKLIWEISRFSHLVTFARAYCLTMDKKYYQAFSNQIDDWVQNNEYSFGVHYKCGQECSIRMVNVLLASTLFEDVGLLTDKDKYNLKIITRDSYKKVLSNFFYAHKCIRNNHTLSELMGMIVGAWCCEDWDVLKKANNYLNEIVEEQFEKDGGYIQYSFNYQRLALMDLSVILSVSDKTNIVIREDLKQRILKSSQILYNCQSTSFDVPNYGANDGALIFKMTSCSYRDFRPVCNTIYRLIEGFELYKSDKHQEELIWLNIEGAELNAVKRKSIKCVDAGLCSIRHNNIFIMLICNNYHRKRPGHMDQMHVDLWVDDINVLCDGGTYSYVSEIGQQLLSNESHNTVVVEGKKQMSIRPPFMVYNWPKRLMIDVGNSKIIAESEYKSGYTHVRTVKKTNYGYEIVDKVNTLGIERIKIKFHTDCDIEKEDNRLLLRKNENVVCVFVSSGIINIEDSVSSLYYFRIKSTNSITVLSDSCKEIITQIIILKNTESNDVITSSKIESINM